MMTSSRTKGLAIAATTALLLTACAGEAGEGGGEQTPSDGQGGGNLVFRSFDPPGPAAGLQEAVDNWNASHDVQVKFDTVPVADSLAQYIREVNGGAGPDVAQQAFVWVQQLAEAGMVIQLDSLAAKTPPGAGLQDFLAMDLSTYNEGVYGLPWSVDTFALAYNPAVLEASGAGEIPKSWPEFKDYATELSSGDTAGFCFPASSGPASESWMLFNYYLWSYGEYVNLDGAVAMSEEKVAEAFTYMNSFFVDGATPLNLLSVETGGDPAIQGALASGTCAMAFLSPGQLRVALDTNPDLRSAPVPAGPEGVTTHLGGRSLTINPNTKNPEAAWEFVQYLASAEVFANYYTGQFVAQKSLLDEVDFGEPFSGYIEELPTAVTFGRYASANAPISELWSTTAQSLGSVFSGQLDPDAAAKDYMATMETLVTGK